VVRASPQRAQEGSRRTGNSVQQSSQIGAEESCGRGEPQREHRSGRRAQLRASRGLRSTRATARQREISDGGTSRLSEPESRLKTHLTWGGLRRTRAALRKVYPELARESIRSGGELGATSLKGRLKPARQAKIRHARYATLDSGRTHDWAGFAL
jgi:hypothetical protein